MDPKAVCSVEKETVATALVNGNNGLGAVVGKFCMDLAIDKAKEAGIGMVVVHGKYEYILETFLNLFVEIIVFKKCIFF